MRKNGSLIGMSQSGPGDVALNWNCWTDCNESWSWRF